MPFDDPVEDVAVMLIEQHWDQGGFETTIPDPQDLKLLAVAFHLLGCTVDVTKPPVLKVSFQHGPWPVPPKPTN